ncbi:hypothetical protein FE257_005435 [Aspergillus nanangensis]|uniref:Uncharacterized protein n=1 Tax=Aspergillus nanangensis TaxID=2582783 RepID=A0AAD4CQK5_ASPNN|nr:hypothetical protein FE257_005435 [Aspergillus nanangensis]
MPSIKPVLHPLKTPKTMTFPSELHSDPSSSLSDNVKTEDVMSTPITPPAAYTEFLKALTPVFASPNSAGVNFSKFTFDNKPAHSPTSQPASAISGSFNFSSESAKSATASLPPPTPLTAPATRAGGPPQLPPLPPLARPRRDPRNLRSLRIPPAVQYSPANSPRSATTIRSPYSPSDWKLRYMEGPHSASGKLSVRHVVTHTVTYKRTELEDPPKGKRRKLHESKES